MDDCSFLRVSALSAVKIAASGIISVEDIHVTGLLFTSKASNPNDQGELDGTSSKNEHVLRDPDNHG